MKKSKDIKKEDFKKDIKSDKGLVDPLKKLLKQKKSPDKKNSLVIQAGFLI